MNLVPARQAWWGARLWQALVSRRVPRGQPGGAERPGGHGVLGEPGLLERRRYYSGVSPDNEGQDSDFASMAEWMTAARAMLRTDPVLAGAWEFVAQRQLGGLDEADWVASEQTQEARRYADFLNENFGLGEWKGRGRLWKGLRQQWRTIITWQPFGASLHEGVTYEARDRQGVMRTWLRELAPRSLSRLEGWDPCEDGTGVQGAWLTRASGERYLLPIARHPDFPGKWSLLISADIEGGDPEGRMGAMLRRAYGAYRIKRLAGDELGVGLERWGAEMPVGRINYEIASRIPGMGDNRLREAERALERTMRDMRATEEAYARDSDLAEIRPFGARFDPTPINTLAEFLNREMLFSFYSQGLAMGAQASSPGAYNQALVHSDGSNQIIANLAEHTAEAVTLQVGQALIRQNFGEGAPVPWLRLSGIRTNPLPDMAAHIAQAMANGSMTPTDDVEAALRRASGLPVSFPSRSWEERMGRASGPAPAVPGPGRGHQVPVVAGGDSA